MIRSPGSDLEHCKSSAIRIHAGPWRNKASNVLGLYGPARGPARGWCVEIDASGEVELRAVFKYRDYSAGDKRCVENEAPARQNRSARGAQ